MAWKLSIQLVLPYLLPRMRNWVFLILFLSFKLVVTEDIREGTPAVNTDNEPKSKREYDHALILFGIFRPW